ncbi:hypothetical protein HZC27_00860 [Candidatus Roizmanbacteria bacterium]|nr:hypothetical protein [Candidatus Roizmanbacteria bacterium]
MAAEAPKKVSLLPEVGKNVVKGGVIGAALLLAINLIYILPPLVVGAAVAGGLFGLINWAMNL